MLKIRTGDIFLNNRYTLNSLITHSVDVDTRWSDIGIFHVQEHTNGEDTVSVFMLTKDGAKKILLDYLLRNPLLQGAAHRRLKTAYQAGSNLSIHDAMLKLENTKREETHIMVSEYKGKNPSRTGLSDAELAGKLLEAGGLLTFERGMLISNFQEGGVVDQFYDKEIAIFPRQSNVNRKDAIIKAASDEAYNIIVPYYEAKPVMTQNNFKAQTKMVTSSNKKQHQEVLQPLQMPTITKDRKKDFIHTVAHNTSESTTRRLRKIKEMKDIKNQDIIKQKSRFHGINE